jgi:hypothetical protein
MRGRAEMLARIHLLTLEIAIMRATTVAKLASGKVIAGIIRGSLHCPFCGHAQAGSAYSVCPDCNRFNPDWQKNAIAQRLLRHAEFDAFPHKHANLLALWRAYQRLQRDDLALRIASYVRAHTICKPKPLSPTERESARKFTKRIYERFAIDDAFESLFARVVYGTPSSRDAAGNSDDGEPYDGESVLERAGIEAERVQDSVRALAWGGASDEDTEMLASTESVVADMLARVRDFDREAHERAVEKFFARHSRSPETNTLDGKPVRKYRVFVGIRYPCGTYSFGWSEKHRQTREHALKYTRITSSRRYRSAEPPKAYSRNSRLARQQAALMS